MNTTVQLKLKRLQALRSDESGVITSLRNLTEFHEPHLVPQEDRRTLRGAVEQRSIAINHAFLAAFDGLSERLKTVEADATAVSDDLDVMAGRLSAIKASSRVLVEQVTTARAAIRANDERRSAIAAFLEAFELTDAEKALLSRPAGVGAASAGGSGASCTFAHGGAGRASARGDAQLDVDAVLAVLERLAAMSARALELQRTGQQAVGIELRDEMARWEERGHQQLYHWLVSRAHELGAPHADAPGAPSTTFARALRALRKCTPLFAACVRELAAARSQIVADAFQLALTDGGGGPSGARAIELLAAEPTSYIDAMLAWFYTAALAERAALDALCEPEVHGAAATRSADDGVPAGGAPDGDARRAMLADAVLASLERAGRILELRVGAVVESISAAAAAGAAAAGAPAPGAAARGATGRAFGAIGPLCALSLALRSFAARLAETFGAPLIGAAPSAAASGGVGSGPAAPPLVIALLRCAERADASADASLGALLQRAAETVAIPPTDLACPAAMLNALEGTIEVLRAIERADATPRERAARACAIADRAVGALCHTLDATGVAERRAPAPAAALTDAERIVFGLNCASALAGALADVAMAANAATPAAPDVGACAAACAPHVARLRTDVARLCDALVEAETGALFERCGLTHKLAALQTARERPELRLAAIPSLEPAAMAALMRTVYAMLYGATAGSAGASLTPSCDRVVDGALRQLATKRVCRTVALAHRSLHEAISEPRNGYVDAEPRVALHSPAQVETLLDCGDAGS